MIDKEKLTVTQLKIVEKLEDGNHHTAKELVSLLPDELGNKKNIKVHICHIRKKLHPGFLIVFTSKGRREAGYMLVRKHSRENRGLI